MADNSRRVIEYVWASGTTNKNDYTTQTDITNGIVYEGNIVSNQLNGIVYGTQIALRDTETSGGFYSQSMTYNQGDFVCQIVTQNSKTNLCWFKCKNNDVKGKPPIKNSGTDFNQRTPVIENDGMTEDTANWERMGVELRRFKRVSARSNYSYRIIPSAYQNKVSGKLKIKMWGSGSTGADCYAEIIFMGSIQNFKIVNVMYSSRVRGGGNKGNGVDPYYPGFFLSKGNDDILISVINNIWCSTIELDFEELNCIADPIEVSFWTGTPYAIRDGGGSYIPNLGDIVSNIRNSGTSSYGDTSEFYYFMRGCKIMTNYMSLDRTQYHQWNNGNMASINLDISGTVLRNKGGNAGSSNGVIQNQALPDVSMSGTFSGSRITGSLASTGRLPILGMAVEQQSISQSGCLRYSSSSSSRIIPQTAAGSAVTQISFDATPSTSVSFRLGSYNSTYSGGDVRMKSLVTTFLLQCF